MTHDKKEGIKLGKSTHSSSSVPISKKTLQNLAKDKSKKNIR